MIIDRQDTTEKLLKATIIKRKIYLLPKKPSVAQNLIGCCFVRYFTYGMIDRPVTPVAVSLI